MGWAAKEFSGRAATRLGFEGFQGFRDRSGGLRVTV